jgi:hypothetical protein
VELVFVILKSVTNKADTREFKDELKDGKFIFYEECPYRDILKMPESRGQMSPIKWAVRRLLKHTMKEEVRAWAIQKS